MFFFLCLLLLKYIGEVQLAKPKAVNLALETVIQFDKKHSERDLQLIDGIQSLLSKVKNVMTVGNRRRQNEVGKKFTDYLVETVDVLKSLEDSDLEQTFRILNEECKKFDYEGSRFKELLENEDLKTMFEDLTGKMSKSRAEDIREMLDEVKEKLEVKVGRYSGLFDFLNALYGDEILNKFDEFFKNIQAYKKSRQKSLSNLNHLMKDGIRSVIFDHYSKLDETARRGFRSWLDNFLIDKFFENKASNLVNQRMTTKDPLLQRIFNYIKGKGDNTESTTKVSYLQGAIDIIYPYIKTPEYNEQKSIKLNARDDVQETKRPSVRHKPQTTKAKTRIRDKIKRNKKVGGIISYDSIDSSNKKHSAKHSDRNVGKKHKKNIQSNDVNNDDTVEKNNKKYIANKSKKHERKKHKRNRKEPETEVISSDQKNKKHPKRTEHTGSHHGKKHKVKSHENKRQKTEKTRNVRKKSKKRNLPKNTKPINRKINENNFDTYTSAYANNYGIKNKALDSAPVVINRQNKGNNIKLVKPSETAKAKELNEMQKGKLSISINTSEEPLVVTFNATKSAEDAENEKITTKTAEKKKEKHNSDSDTEESHPFLIPFKENREKDKSKLRNKVSKLGLTANNTFLENFIKRKPKRRPRLRADSGDTDDVSGEDNEKAVNWSFNTGSSSPEDESPKKQSRRDLDESEINSSRKASTDSNSEEGMSIEDLEVKSEAPKTNAVVTNKDDEFTEASSHSEMKISTTTTVTEKTTTKTMKTEEHSPNDPITTPMFRSEVSDTANHSAEASVINNETTTVTANNTFVTDDENSEKKSTVETVTETTEESTKMDIDDDNEVLDRSTKYDKINEESNETSVTTASFDDVSVQSRAMQNNGERSTTRIYVPNYYKTEDNHRTISTNATADTVGTTEVTKISNETRRFSHDDINFNKLKETMKEDLKKFEEKTMITTNPDGSKNFPINLTFT